MHAASPPRPAVLRSLGSRLRAALLRETYALPLDLFRVLVGCLCLAYFIRLLLEVEDFSSPDGLLDHVLLVRILWFTRLSLFQPGLGTWFFYAMFGVACLGALGIVLGYRVKLWAALLFAITVSSYRWNFIVLSVDDSIMHLLLFWLLLLPIGRTVVVQQWWQQRSQCWRQWSQVTVPGTALYCLLGNICLVYLTAGLCKLLKSTFWREGFALYAILRQPITYAPDMWGPQHLPLLQVGTYLALGVELLLPFLLTRRPGHPLKWLGLLLQLGFHLGIIATLRVPFANLALMATAILFFRVEIMRALARRWQQCPVTLRQAPRVDRAGRVALLLVGVLTLAMMRGLPGVGVVHKPAFALLWMVGLAQDYQLFKWVDRLSYHVEHQVVLHTPQAPRQSLPPTTVFPSSMRGVLLQVYLHNRTWMPLSRQHYQSLKHSILTRLAQRFCRTHATTGRVTAWSTIQRIRPENVALTQGKPRFIMEFSCSQDGAVLCRTLLAPHNASTCPDDRP